MLLKVEGPSPVELLTVRQRIFGTARGLILQWRDRPHLLFDVYTFGAPPQFRFVTDTREQAFIRMMRHFEAEQAKADGVGTNPNAVPSINAGLTDAHYGEIYEALCSYVKMVADKGRWRKRRT